MRALLVMMSLGRLAVAGALCTVGLTNANNDGCITGMNIGGTVPVLKRTNLGVKLSVPAGNLWAVGYRPRGSV